jgi:ubiquinone/menaquinone biosynthesis C-methylase UbiE
VVVASDTGGLPEHIIDGLNAFLCPPGDYKTWAGKISYICENINNLRKSMKFDFALPRTEVYGEKLKRVCTAAASKEYTNGFFVDHKSDILRICEVTGNRENKVKQRLLKEIRKPGISVKTAWLEAGPPKNKEEIEAFYRSTDAYLYDLVVVHTTWERVTKRNRALSFLINNNCKTVLDYGAGIGKDSLLFASAGLDVTYYEPSKYLLRFAESAAKEEKTRLVTISEINLLEPASFDVIYCAKVLEHVVESMVEMVRISRLLKCGGYLLMTAGFNQTSEKFLSHLPSNVRYHERIDLLANKMKMSMREVIPIPGNRMYVFNRT